MSKPPPPKHFVSDLSDEDNEAKNKASIASQQQQASQAQDAQPPPPPPPPPMGPAPAQAQPQVSIKNRISPPSALRQTSAGVRGASKNSVAFSGVMGNLNTTESSSSPVKPATTATLSQPSPTPSAKAAATASAMSRPKFVERMPTPHLAGVAISSRRNSKLSSSFNSQLSVDKVINSQFENEAETHILAALEMEESYGLLGEGIEDYSDDDDDEDETNANEHHQRNASSWTHENDTFLSKMHMQNDLPQYQVGLSMSPSSMSSTSPVKQSQQQQQQHLQQSSLSTQHHRRPSSSRGSSGNLPSVPDDAAMVYSQNIAAHIENDNSEAGGDPFIEGAKARAAAVKKGVVDMFDTNIGGDRGGTQLEDVEEGDETKGSNEDDTEQHHDKHEEFNTINHATEATDNINFMAKQLRSLQQKRGTIIRQSSTRFRRSSVSSETGSSMHGDAEPESNTDKLFDALNSVDSRNKSLWGRLYHEFWLELVMPKMPIFRQNISHSLLFVVFPFLSAAALLFYMLDNPMAGETGTSISWWILFLGVRQVIMFELTRVGEVFWVEILALRSKVFNMAVGPYVSLAFIQSKGWPYIVCFWAVLDFCFLYGAHPFAKHWLFWQNKLDLFNEANPVVGVTDSNIYMRILISFIFFGTVVSLKRLFLAIYLGRRTVAHFGSELEKLMAKMILIGEVANLARDIENKRALFEGPFSPSGDIEDDEKLVRFRDYMRDEYSSADESPSPHPDSRKVLEVSPSSSAAFVPGAPTAQHRSPPITMRKSDGSTPPSTIRKVYGSSTPPRPSPIHTSPSDSSHAHRASTSDFTAAGDKTFDSTANVKLMNLLSEWEEPELTSTKRSKATVRDIVEFRKAVSYCDDKYPFSHAFGRAKTREMCIQSSQEVYDRLMLSASDCSALPFSILSVLAMDENGDLIAAKIKSLIRLLRPDRQGNLSRLDFVKSIDTVYKQLRLLRASIANSAQVDQAFERIINVFFYFFLVVITVAILGFNVWTVFLSFNTFFLGFSFLFGAAASNYFEGLLLIFVRRPYDIGDRIATSSANRDTDPNGSSTWYVEKVTLFTTTVRFATTNEVATYSNGSLAILRIINANRSPKAIVSVLIKFGLETPFSKVAVFRTAVENFIKARPREWVSLAGFRATRVEADSGYIEYKIVGQHRESWQNIGPILQSKADLASFVLEATKKLDMRYESPPMPVNLSTSGKFDLNGIFQGESDEPQGDIGDKPKSMSAEDLEDVANLFEIRKKQ